jgi:hypothetical protein
MSGIRPERPGAAADGYPERLNVVGSSLFQHSKIRKMRQA